MIGPFTYCKLCDAMHNEIDIWAVWWPGQQWCLHFPETKVLEYIVLLKDAIVVVKDYCYEEVYLIFNDV